MKRTILFLLTICFGSTLFSGAGSSQDSRREPWDAKPFNEWSHAEAVRILEDSPWSRKAASPVGPLTVRWTSARAMREAFLRSRYFEQKPKFAERELELLSKPTNNHEIVISPFNLRSSPDSLRLAAASSAVLELKNSKKKINATKVEAPMGGFMSLEVRFYFPRDMGSGSQPTIGADEQEATLSARIANIQVKAKFDLRKMMRNGKPDL